MKKLVAKPSGWPCKLKEAPPGHITGTGEYAHCVWFKSEYRTPNGVIEAYNEGGEHLCIEPDELVQPIEFEWEEED